MNCDGASSTPRSKPSRCARAPPPGASLGACVYAACLFGWEIKWGHHPAAPRGALGTMFQLQWPPRAPRRRFGGGGGVGRAAAAPRRRGRQGAARGEGRRWRVARAPRRPRPRARSASSRSTSWLPPPGRAGMPDRAALRGSRAAAARFVEMERISSAGTRWCRGLGDPDGPVLAAAPGPGASPRGGHRAPPRARPRDRRLQ